jgi:hypothetical protein
MTGCVVHSDLDETAKLASLPVGVFTGLTQLQSVYDCMHVCTCVWHSVTLSLSQCSNLSMSAAFEAPHNLFEDTAVTSL